MKKQSEIEKTEDLFMGYCIWFGGRMTGWYSNFTEYLIEVNHIEMNYPKSFYKFNLTKSNEKRK